jgi:protein-S-isoprenylcysteine O-methyltransferase Ste14
MIIWGEVIGQIAGVAATVLAVTAAAYLWQMPQAHGQQAIVITYSISILLMFAAVWVIFRRIVRRDYRQNGRLTPIPVFLQLLIWGLYFAFPCIYNPIEWAWTQSEVSFVIPILGKTGWACVWTGLIIILGAFAWLGLPRSFGQKARKLETSGPYCLTRNPQIVGGAILVIGCVLLWPSWYMMGWLALFAAMTHLMVLAEEEHLHKAYGEEYERYCKQVPRYLGFSKK